MMSKNLRCKARTRGWRGYLNGKPVGGRQVENEIVHELFIMKSDSESTQLSNSDHTVMVSDEISEI